MALQGAVQQPLRAWHLPDQPIGADENIARKDVTVVGGKVYLTRQQVPLHYPISEHTLAKLASDKRGPRFFKPTDKAVYLPANIEAWIEAAAVCRSPTWRRQKHSPRRAPQSL